MPRGGRGQHGGPRQGVSGRNYPNRTDIQLAPKKLPIEAAPGQPYGTRKAQEDAQRAVPIATPAVLPGSLPPLDADTARPEEPVTAGLPIGPGPGPEAMMRPAGDGASYLRGLYGAFPSEGLRELLEEIDELGL